MKSVVIYKSKTGFTKKYAEWISEELSSDIYDLTKDTPSLTCYDIVIYGGGLYAVGINGVKWLLKNMHMLKDKKVVVFATGVSPLREGMLEEITNNNFTSEQQKLIRFFYLRGGFNYKNLRFIDKVLMALLKMFIIWKKKRNQKLTSDEIGMLEVYDKPADFTKRTKIDEIISYINS